MREKWNAIESDDDLNEKTRQEQKMERLTRKKNLSEKKFVNTFLNVANKS